MVTMTQPCSSSDECCETQANSSGRRRFRNKTAFFRIGEGRRNLNNPEENGWFLEHLRKRARCETRSRRTGMMLTILHLLTNSPRIPERNGGLLTKSCFSSGEVFSRFVSTPSRTRTCEEKNHWREKRRVNKPRFGECRMGTKMRSKNGRLLTAFRVFAGKTGLIQQGTPWVSNGATSRNPGFSRGKCSFSSGVPIVKMRNVLNKSPSGFVRRTACPHVSPDFSGDLSPLCPAVRSTLS